MQSPGGGLGLPGFDLDPASRRNLIRQVLGDSMGTLIVTPKEVDVMVDTLSDILADGLNEALHPGHLRRRGGSNPLMLGLHALTTARNPSTWAAICSAMAAGSSPAQSLGKWEAMTVFDRPLLDVGEGVVERRAHGGSGPLD